MTSKNNRLAGLAKEFDALLAASSSTLVVHEYTSTPGQTVFTGADNNGVVLNYLPGSVLVALNGYMLQKTSDYAATNGTSITLTSSSSGDELLQVFAFGTFTVANHYTKAEDDAKFVQKTAIIDTAHGGTGATSMGAGAVGTVTQSAGIPTGAIIERGSNAQGSYVRYADGTMICWLTFSTNAALNNSHANGNLFGSPAIYPLTFPAAFATTPTVAASASLFGAATGVVWPAAWEQPGVNSWGGWLALTTVSTGAFANIRLIATGRWF